MKTVSSEIRRAFKESGMTKFQVAHDTGLSNSQLTRFFSKGKSLRHSAIDTLFAYFFGAVSQEPLPTPQPLFKRVPIHPAAEVA